MDSEKTKDEIILDLFPYLKDIDTLLPILNRMGFNSHGIRELLTTGEYGAFVRAIDPDCDIEYVDCSRMGVIRYALKDVGGEWQIYINDKPYKEYFAELRERDNKPLHKKGKFLDEISENIIFRQAIQEFKSVDNEAYEKLVSIIKEKGEIFIK